MRSLGCSCRRAFQRCARLVSGLVAKASISICLAFKSYFFPTDFRLTTRTVGSVIVDNLHCVDRCRRVTGVAIYQVNAEVRPEFMSALQVVFVPDVFAKEPTGCIRRIDTSKGLAVAVNGGAGIGREF